MCGISGVVGQTTHPDVFQSMVQAMRHRGPDGTGFWRSEDAGFGFCRLAIVDVEGGQQPMGNEDGRVQVIFNGEIYDHHKLRHQLQDRGHRFVTHHSDTEVLVHGWEEWRYDLFTRLNGMFGVGIWDNRTRSLILARDRYGIKPLYYAPLAGGGLIFASEIKAILASGLVPAKPSYEGILEYWCFQNLARSQTMFRGIHQLEPASLLTWHDGKYTTTRYWDISFPRSRTNTNVDDLADEHRDILSRALKRQMAADVPVKSYLSGGIDSTAITVYSQRIDPDVTAYSCIFDLDGVGDDRMVDEREFSRLVAHECNVKRIELQLSADSLTSSLHDYVTALEDLRMGMGYCVYWMAHRVAQDAKVVLSGTGGDEYHAGYVRRYQCLGIPHSPVSPIAQTNAWLKFFRRWVRNQVKASQPPQPTHAGSIYRALLNFMFKPEQWQDVFTTDFLRQASGFHPNELMDDFLNQCPSDDWRDRVMYVDAKTYLQGLLVMEDKVSMAHSLETRVPLLDNELVDFLLDVPFEHLWKGSIGKHLFRESVRPWVPQQIYTKPKVGFAPPDASWYRGKLRRWIEEMLSPEICEERGIFQPQYVQNMLADHFSGKSDYYFLIWSMLSFEAWCRAFGFFGASQSPVAEAA